MDSQAAVTPEEIWTQAFLRVQRAIDVPTVWMAMEAARPLALEGNHLIVGMAPSDQYLRVNLQTHEYATAIDDALAAVAGRPLALHVIEGFAIESYHEQQALEAVAAIEAQAPRSASRPEVQRPEPSVSPHRPEPARPAPSQSTSAFQAPRSQVDESVEVIPSWDRLNERLTTGFKRMPLARYPHGQAAFLLHAVKMISATMDLVMDAPFGQADPIQERNLAKCIERLGVTVSLDPLFISLELIRYRREMGRDIGFIPQS
jgi:hypothetical protein